MNRESRDELETTPRPPWVEELRDVSTLRGFLVGEPEKTAYFLGDLEPRYFEVTRWFVERDAAGLRGLVMLYNGHSMPAVLMYGDETAVAHIIERSVHRLPRRFELRSFPEHRETIGRLFPGVNFTTYLRMALRPPQFADVFEAAGVSRLSHGDTAEVVRLYARAGLSYFDPYQLETGLYFGIFQDGMLVSVAGVHVASEEDGVAAIGSAATHPDYRGAHLSRRCSSRLIRELFHRRIQTIALNVAASNRPAVRLYDSLGFEHVTELFVGVVGGDAHDSVPHRRIR